MTRARTRLQVLRPENTAKFESMSLGDYLHGNGYSDAFIQQYILPMCAAVWSMPSSKVRPFTLSLAATKPWKGPSSDLGNRCINAFME